MLAKYDYITEDTLAYFSRRPEQASRDSDFALAYVLQPCRHAGTPAGGDRRAGVQMRYTVGHARRASTRLWRGRETFRPAPSGRSQPDDGAARKSDGFAADRCRRCRSTCASSSIRCGRPSPCCRRKRYSGRTRSASTYCAAATDDPTVGHIIADLAADYDAEQEDVAADVIAFLQEWSDKLLVKL